ncbi:MULTISPECIES: hypothetical protein [Microbacterium]|uniref:D-alanyl-D-alanine carboxypeptidase n=1 Tax=Microbacterium paraoxydans TaxID=199592 RepID=A0A1H1L8P6_9MICO|nr:MULTISPECIES: hypothetical protein [Microbacterium]SDR70843.1 hypothetical protein SAMN04489809_0023 [Microbacterium paraoxydans]SDR72700.1 hypothetical protein SAMN04489809_0099 [Microbacterium paraoxydans]
MGGLVIETVRPGVQFIPDAAAAFRRADAQVLAEFGRHIDVNSTYRSWSDQMLMFVNWGRYVSSGYKAALYPGHSKAVHPSESFHVAGTALDSDDWVNARIVEILAENGFIRNRLYVPNENHHFEYIRARDTNYGKPATTGHAATPIIPAGEEDEDDMYVKNVMHHKINADKRMEVKVSNPGSGFELNFITGSKDTLQAFADQYETGNSMQVSASVFRVIGEACAAVRPQGQIAVSLGDADA